MKATLPLFLVTAWTTVAQAAPDAYLAWATSKWGTATTGSVVQRTTTWGENADPDRDGIANLIEYACDTDPTQHNPASDCWQFFLPDSGVPEYRYPQLKPWIHATAPGIAGVPRNYTLTIGGQSATWSFTAGSITAVPDHSGTDSGYTPSRRACQTPARHRSASRLSSHPAQAGCSRSSPSTTPARAAMARSASASRSVVSAPSAAWAAPLRRMA